MKSNTAMPLCRSASVIVDAAQLVRAEELQGEVSKATEEGLARAVAQAVAAASTDGARPAAGGPDAAGTQGTASDQAIRWLDANRAALRSSNEFVKRHGRPLARHRQFRRSASPSTRVVAVEAGCSMSRPT